MDAIQKMFSEMGLDSPEQREKIVKDLSINTAESYLKVESDFIISNNT